MSAFIFPLAVCVCSWIYSEVLLVLFNFVDYFHNHFIKFFTGVFPNLLSLKSVDSSTLEKSCHLNFQVSWFSSLGLMYQGWGYWFSLFICISSGFFLQPSRGTILSYSWGDVSSHCTRVQCLKPFAHTLGTVGSISSGTLMVNDSLMRWPQVMAGPLEQCCKNQFKNHYLFISNNFGAVKEKG